MITKKDLTHILFIPDYNNMHFTDYCMIYTTSEVFHMDWTRIINKEIPHDYLSGAGPGDVQIYMQNHHLPFMVIGTNLAENWVTDYHNANDHNKAYTKIVKHHNIGNY